MANFCYNFNEALKNVLAITTLNEDVFSFSDNKVTVANGEGLRNLSIQLLTRTNQTPRIIDEELINDIISSLEDEEVEITKEQAEEIIKNIIKSFNSLRYLKRELRPNKDNNLPRLSSSLSDNFLGDNTLKLFSKWFNSSLVNSAVLMQSDRIVRSTTDLNFSIQNLKQRYVDTLADYLGMDRFTMYKDLGVKGYELQILPYNLLLEKAKAVFSSELENGKYKASNNIKKDEAFYSFFSLLNFDKLITNHNFEKTIGISRTGLNLKGYNAIPLYNISKYEFSFQQIPSQKWDEDLSKESDEANPLVKKFLENIRLVERINSKEYREIPNQYLSYRNFKEVLRILKENPITSNLYSQLRNDPYGITRLFEHANTYRISIFSGKNEHVRTLFDTIYYRLFSSKTDSLAKADLNSAKMVSDFDIYGMILNQVNKTSFVTYSQYIYNKLDKTNGVSILNSSDINGKKYTIERSIMINGLYKSSRLKVLKKWNANFGEGLNYYLDDQGGSNLNTITLKKDEDNIFVIDFSNPNNPSYFLNGELIQKSSLQNINFLNILGELLSDFTYIYSDDVYTHILSQILDSDAKLNGVLDVITASLLNLNGIDKFKENPSIYTITSLYPNISMADRLNSPWKYFNSETKTLKLSGFFSALNGLESLAVAQSIINGDSSKSNVVDANGNKLQKERLTNLTNDVHYYFENLLQQTSNNILDERVVNYNIFTSNGITDKSKLLRKTELKTLYNSYYNSTPKKINKATDSETNYLAFVYDFLTRTDEVSIQPTVYSDKSTIWNIVIGTDIPLEASWIPENLKGKTLKEMLPEDIRLIKYEASRRMAGVFLNRVLSDYKVLVNTGMFGKVEELTDKYHLNDESIINRYKGYLTLFRENATQELVEKALIHLKETTGEMVTIIDQIH